MSKTTEKKEVIVVAREGYSVLLDIEGQTFEIDCHVPINLGSMFPAEVLDRCASLSTHLRDGNLIYVDNDSRISDDVNAAPTINLLREETAQHITAQYTQSERDARRTNTELETRAKITQKTRDHIQEQVQRSKAQILNTDKKLSDKTVSATNDVDIMPKERKSAMTAGELTMKVSMDVDPASFEASQEAARVCREAAEDDDELLAKKEIAEQELKQEQE